ncbi:peptide chain release factor N(5)-glutamine methyltransferase [Tissierella sp. Yu-01]|uniref:peptide chain release factor N(5)-glutamine methyltransferase n=1 Tax=Tissierella sp. Yu-01 TaxID=3035694 RepID=UPI00240D7A94|nr:peptide chain release factor N(5)-glutamine methyltransferase [Tissierella sp. Yu-01]WFA08678.1 peptide chain release factor N(5)-glutamine methyltransferase [Tissierella sp. Yu-01]
MVINELLKLGVSMLGDNEYSNPQLESRLILSKLLDVDKTYLYAYGEKEVSNEIEDKFLELLTKRSKGYPFQYIFNEKEFMGLDFYVEEGVLVPRPDTEILVEYVLDYINKNHSNETIKVLDLGSGSGAISLSIAKHAKNTYVYGVDIDNTPLKVCNINKERFNLANVEFIKGDMFEPIMNFKKSFHIIASNPPYIPSTEIENLQTEVKEFEPRLALDGGDDGLIFYRRISFEAKDFLVDDGLLIFEIGFNQGKEVKEILENQGFKNIMILKDLQGLDRVILGRA